MPKKNRSNRRPGKKEEIQDRDVDDVDGTNEDYFYDEIDKFHSEKEKILLEQDSDSENEYASDEEEVLGIVSDESDAEENDEGDEQYEETAQAWGTKKSSFYGTDAIENLEGSDREEAEREEEEEVIAIQRRLALQIDEEDFGFDMLQETAKDTNQPPTRMEKVIEADFSSLSRKAQWKLVKKQSPELEGLIDDFKEKVTELRSELCPLMQMIRRGDIPQGYGTDLISLKFRVYLAYIMNISFYLMLKTNKTAVQNHPVISRLVQYKTVINRLSPLSKKLQPEIKKILSNYSENRPGHKANAGSLFDDNGDLKQDSTEQRERRTAKKGTKRTADEVVKSGRTSLDLKAPSDIVDNEFSKSMNEKLFDEERSDARPEDVSDEDNNGDERRAINYEIAKNKGLKQKRRKIDRNPRVKMREKFRKAKIRRRGQVREYRPELKKYSGEASGIRIGVKKSVTLQ